MTKYISHFIKVIISSHVSKSKIYLIYVYGV